jgi:hypothetical protein
VRKRALGLLGALLLASCAGSSEEVKPAPAADLPEAEAPEFSGMIPPECQALLEKSQDWGFTPGGKWKPSSPVQALEVLRFFGDFHFVPQRTADLYRNFLSGALPGTEAEAKPFYARYSKLQVCDGQLAQGFLEGLINYPWPADQKREAQTEIFQFVLNQQARVMPFVPRLIALEVHRKALAKGLARGNMAELKSVIAQAESGRAKIYGARPKTAVEQLQNLREELDLSERLRERLARSLPLP